MSRTLRPAAGWTYLASFISVGASLTLIGPSLSYLRDRAGVTDGDIAILFPAASVGYLLGSLLSGRFYDHGFGHRTMAGGLLGVACAVLMLPHASTVPAMCVVFGLVGVFASCVDVGGNTLVLWHRRGQGSARLLNALHLFFGVGALVSPLLVNRSLKLTDGLGLAAGAIAIYAVIVAAVFLVHETPVHTEHAETPDAPPTPRRLLLIISIFFVLYVGIEIGFSGWLKTYAEAIDLPGVDSPTWLNTLFYVSFTFGRLIAVPLSKHVRPGWMLVGSCGLTSVFLLVMALAAGSPPYVWVCTGLIGITMAPQFATMIAYAEEHVALSGRATSWFVASAGFGGLLLPWLIGQLLDQSADAMPIAVFAGAVVTTGWIAVVRHALINHERKLCAGFNSPAVLNPSQNTLADQLVAGQPLAASMNAGDSPPPWTATLAPDTYDANGEAR